MNDRIDISQWRRLGALFEQAINMDAAEQAELLRTTEREDAELAQALASLLAADAEHQTRTAEHRQRVLQGSLDAIEVPDMVVGDRVGPYVLRESLGQGGMGVVFRAERADGQMRHEVALKVIKLGMDTREVIARFEAERQALALMDHPHIARMFDAGATASGRPYFVMELVKGEPISAYCLEHDLSIVQRLQLFDQVCAAVQHAHTKGIIHRDLKPSNVLVIAQDGQPCAKVIDFGIAKAISGRLTDKTLLTERFLMMGTPLYMSPEQAAGSADIDTRTDIYALGVILYELLTDTTPIESDSLRRVAHAEVQRIIREVDPPRPSVRLSNSTRDRSITTKSGAAPKHGMEPRSLARTVRGDLDWIAMKAIEKDRARRYETANALALDVRRYLAGEAVLAAPPGAVYRMRKFVRRNRGAVAAGSLIAIALLAGIAAFAWQARIAQQRANEVEQVAKFEADMLKQVDPTEAGKQLMDDMQAKFAAALVKAGVPDSERAGQSTAFAGLLQRVNATDTARDLIDRTTLKPAIAAIDKQFPNQPLVAATLRQVLADRYVAMGLFDAAMPLQQNALATRRRVLGEDHPDTLQSINSMGELLETKGEAREAEPYLREALEKRRRVLGEGHPDTLESMVDLGDLLLSLDRLSEAEPYLQEGLKTSRRVFGEKSAETAAVMAEMGVLLEAQGKVGEGETLLREAVAQTRRVLGQDDPTTVEMVGQLGVALVQEGKLGEAEPYLREVLGKSRRDLGDEHPNTLQAISTMGTFLRSQGKPGEAEPYVREVEQTRRRVLGEQSPETLMAIEFLGTDLMEQGKLSEAEPYLREVLDKSRRVHGDKDRIRLNVIGRIGALLIAQGKYAEAEKLLAPSEVETRKSSAFYITYVRSMILMNLGKARAGLGEFAAAETVLLQAQATLDGAEPEDIDTRKSTQAVVDLYRAWNIAEPGKGYDTKAAQWKQKLDKMDARLPATAVH